MTDKERIEKIIKDTFDVIQKVYHTQREGDSTQREGDGNHKDFCKSQSRIIFPKYSEQYRDSETRISEQELRFIFVEQFNKGWFYKYLYISSEVIRKRPCKLSYFVRRSHVLRSKNTRTSFEGR